MGGGVLTWEEGIRCHGNNDQERSQGCCDLPLALDLRLLAESGVLKQGLQADQALGKTSCH